MANASVDDVVKTYKRYFPEYTEASLRKAIKAIRRKKHRMNSPELAYYMQPCKYGGLGYGKRKKK